MRGRATIGSCSQIGSFYGGDKPGGSITHEWLQCPHPPSPSFSSLLSSPFPKTKKDLTRIVPLAVNIDYGVYVCAGSNVNGALEAPSKIKRSYWPEGLKYWPHVP